MPRKLGKLSSIRILFSEFQNDDFAAVATVRYTHLSRLQQPFQFQLLVVRSADREVFLYPAVVDRRNRLRRPSAATFCSPRTNSLFQKREHGSESAVVDHAIDQLRCDIDAGELAHFYHLK